TKVRNSAFLPNDGSSFSWSSHKANDRPLHNSRPAMQSTLGRSPGLGIHSPSTPHTSSKGRSFLVTCSPSQEQRMLWTVDQASFVLECETEDFGGLELGPDGIAEPGARCFEHLIALVLFVGVEPHPFLSALQQADFLGAVVFVLVSLAIRQTDGDDAHSTV